MLQKKAHESYWNTSEEEKNTKLSISWNKKKKKNPQYVCEQQKSFWRRKSWIFSGNYKRNNSKTMVLKYNKFFLSMKKKIFVGQKCLYFMPKLLSEKWKKCVWS